MPAAARPSPTTALLSVGQVAAILKLHVRTIRSYVRSGALAATRIGKQYRIALSDLEAFAGRPVETHHDTPIAAGGRVDIVSVFTVERLTQANAYRVATALEATTSESRGSLAVTTAFDVERERLRIMVSADLPGLRRFIAVLDAILGPLATL